MSTISDIARQSLSTVKKNSPAILTGLGAAGVVTTAYLAGKAAFFVGAAVSAEEARVAMREDWDAPLPTFKVVFLKHWKAFIPAAAVGTASVVCIIGANHISSRRNAALISVYTISERAFDEYKAKVVEQIGTNQEQKVRDAVAQDRVDATPLGESNFILMTNGDVLCFDDHTGRYFASSVEKIRKVENDINYELLNGDGNVSLNEYYHKVGLKAVSGGEDLGWNTDTKFKLVFSTTMSEDKRPCIVITFEKGPKPNFYKLW